MFEVRGMTRQRRGIGLVPIAENHEAVLAHRGLNDVTRQKGNLGMLAPV